MVVPKGWKITEIKNIGEIVTGSTPSTSNRENYGIEFLWASPVDLGNSKYINHTINKLSLKGFNNTRRLPKGSILVVCIGSTIGKMGIATQEMSTNQQINSLICSNEFDSEYIYYSLYDAFPRHTALIAIQAVPIINKLQFSTFEVLLPPLPEQRRIAAVLSDTDKFIAALEKLIIKKRAIKQGAMQELLTGKRRLPGFSGEWVEKRLGELLKYEQPQKYIVSDTEYLTSGTPVLTAGKSLVLGYTVETEGVYNNLPVIIFDDFTTESKLINFKFKVKSSALKLLTSTNMCDIRIVFEHMQMVDFQLRDHQRYWISEYSKIFVKIPPTISEQTAIAQILSDMDAEIDALTMKLTKLKAIKQGMMSELLTGHIRLVEQETITAPLKKVVESTKQNPAVEKKKRSANIHFKRSVWAAEIADRLYREPTFGHVKMEKMIFLTENMCNVDIGSNYHRDAAGPYDNRAIRSIDSQLKQQNWFELVRGDKGYRYIPLSRRGGHKEYFNNYYSNVLPIFDKIINRFRTWSTERCEIVATLYSAWKDLANSKQEYTDEDIIHEVLNNWNKSKKRIEKERWQKALNWMRENGFSPIKQESNTNG